MSSVRAGQPGATRQCPHCKAIVLESATVCPGCRHHLRFNSSGRPTGLGQAYTALSVDGSIAHRSTNEPCEYCIVMEITNERGEQLLRQVVGVGALQPSERRRLKLSIDMLPVVAQAAAPPSAARTQPPASPRAAVAAPAAPAASAASGPARPAPSSMPSPAPRPAAPSAPAAPTATAAVSPATVRLSQPGRATPPPASPKVPPADPAGTLGQRLRIFRKP